MTKEQLNYLSYLLRLYRVSGGGGSQPTTDRAIWRISIENPRTRERKGFASLDDLFDFLRAQVDMSANANGDQDETRPESGQTV
jgi:hypothetical protein